MLAVVHAGGFVAACKNAQFAARRRLTIMEEISPSSRADLPSIACEKSQFDFQLMPSSYNEEFRMAISSTKPFAVVTGASSGIGYELAKQFAQNGFDLLVVADGDGIHKAAGDLQSLGGQVEAFQVNLAEHEGTHKLIAAIQATGRPVDAIALNAGFGLSGRLLRPTSPWRWTWSG